VSAASCLYEGTVYHRRAEPARAFQHRLALAYLDLDELPDLLGGRLLARRPGVVRFRRRDYLGDPRQPLAEAVRELVAERTGSRPRGPIRLLTNLRVLGHCFNPVSFYYCLDPGARELEAIVAEVTNTPWGERHAYVVPGGRGSFSKALHVSPFLGMERTYACHAAPPAEHLRLAIESSDGNGRAFDAGLSLRRRELTPASLRRALVRHPLPSGRVLALIYAHALALRLAGTPVHPHPGRSRA
jgi:DUF1365 family protein